MNESDILRAGMKVVGCYVVIAAVYGLATTLYEAIGIIYVKSNYSPDMQHAFEFFWKWKVSSVAIGILRLILGLYLCTGAKALVKLLQDKERL
jgi:hypothetical protein